MHAKSRLRIREYGARTTMPPHSHPEASINIVVGGEFLERIGSSERLYARGQIAYLPAGVAHSQRFSAFGARQIIFQPQECWLDYLSDCKARLGDTAPRNAPIFRQLGDRLTREIRNDDRFSALACEGLLLEIVAAFARGASTPAESRPPPLPAWLRVARDFIHANARAPLSMAQIARVAGRHEVHLAREFRRHFGASVGTYMRQLRAEHAAQSLRLSGRTVAEIALECGFSSHAHLCREFKAQFGVTPSQYRACRSS
jgi:AraC family transcriptional regulator